MKIYNESKTQLLTEEQCDLTKGYFVEEEIITGTRPSLVETIVNPDGSKTTTQYDSLEIKERILIYKLFTTKDVYEREKLDLEKWFETEYREQFEKCTRRIALGVAMRDGTNPQVLLNTLYAQAEANANRINELQTLINNL